MAKYYVGRGRTKVFDDTALAPGSSFPPAVNQTATSGDATCADMQTMVNVEDCEKVVIRAAANVDATNIPLTVYWFTPVTSPHGGWMGASGHLWEKVVLTTGLASYTAADPNCKWKRRYRAVLSRDQVADTQSIQGMFMAVSVTNNATQSADVRVVIERFY